MPPSAQHHSDIPLPFPFLLAFGRRCPRILRGIVRRPWPRPATNVPETATPAVYDWHEAAALWLEHPERE